MLNRTVNGLPLNWPKSLADYYFRDEWELYDLSADPVELVNLRRYRKYKVTSTVNYRRYLK